MSFWDRHLLWHNNEALSKVTIRLESRYVSQRWGRREYTHLCVHFLTLAQRNGRSSWTRTRWKGSTIKRALKGKRAAAAIYWGKTSFRFGEAEIRQGAEREREREQNPESRSRVKKWLLCCGLYNSQLCSPYLLLWRKLKCQSVGCPQTVWFWLLLSLLMFVLAHVLLRFIKGRAAKTPLHWCDPQNGRNINR